MSVTEIIPKPLSPKAQALVDEIRRYREELAKIQGLRVVPAADFARSNKGELLEHYAGCPVAYFLEYRACENVLMEHGYTAELRGIPCDVRVHFAEKVSRATALKLLDEIRAAVASGEGAELLGFTTDRPDDSGCPF